MHNSEGITSQLHTVWISLWGKVLRAAQWEALYMSEHTDHCVLHFSDTENNRAKQIIAG